MTGLDVGDVGKVGAVAALDDRSLLTQLMDPGIRIGAASGRELLHLKRIEGFVLEIFEAGHHGHVRHSRPSAATTALDIGRMGSSLGSRALNIRLWQTATASS